MSISTSAWTAYHPTKAMRRRLICLLPTTLVLAGSLGAAWQWTGYKPDETFFVAAVIDDTAHSIQIEAFLPAPDRQTGGRLPAVVLLHGIEGPERYRRTQLQTARWLANQGYAVFRVHYFDAVNYEDLWLWQADGELDKAAIDQYVRRDSQRWTSAVTAAVSAIAIREDVDAARIALDGNSLGGFVALATAARAIEDEQTPDVCALVVNWGAQFETTLCKSGFPPTLHVHGERDNIIPVEWARKSVETIRSVHSEAAIHIVPAASHMARSNESDDVTLRFLQAHLASPEIVADRSSGYGTNGSYKHQLLQELGMGLQ